jgi:pSer/pThr/pTyr-binding forkhead associated (FHA) protein
MSDAGPCPSCGYRNPLGSNFCSSCGAQLGSITEHHTEAIEPTVSTPVVNVADAGDVPGGVGMLIVRQGSKRGSRMALDTDRVTIGRHPESDIFLDDITVSRRHAEVIRTESGHDVIDAGSLNGTYINRELVERGTLADGDELQVGKFKLVYVALGDAADGTTPSEGAS